MTIRPAFESLLLLFLAWVANAQQQNPPDETLPGFKANQVYQVGDIDAVNVFSGDVGLSVPLGPKYSLSAGLDWQLRAHYSAKFWFLYRDTCGGSQQDQLCGGPIIVSRGQVNGNPTLGVGWTLELGFIDPGYQGGAGGYYHGSDGSRHEYLTPPLGQIGTGITGDGSLLRVTAITGGYTVEFPDGTIHTLTHSFSRFVPSSPSVDFQDVPRTLPTPNRYGLTSIADRFGTTVLTVTYVATNDWKVDHITLNPTGQARTIQFNWNPTLYEGTFPILSSILFPVLATPSTSLTTTFTFAPTGTGLIGRTNFDSGGPNDDSCPSAGPTTADLPFLTAITQAGQVHGLTYSLNGGTGWLTRVTLPTGGTLDYAWLTNTGPTPCIVPAMCTDPEVSGSAFPGGPAALPFQSPGSFLCQAGGRYGRFISATPALQTRTATDPFGGPRSVTTYERAQFAPARTDIQGGLPDPVKTIRRIIVRRQDGNGNLVATKYFFHSAVAFSDETDYSGGIELERRYYPGTDTSSAATAIRTLFNCYDFVNNTTGPVCGVYRNGAVFQAYSGIETPRQRSVTWFGAPYSSPPADTTSAYNCTSASTPPCLQTASSTFVYPADEYSSSTTTFSSSIPSMANWSGRTTSTTWTYVNPSAYPPAGHWLPKLFTSRQVSDGYGGSCPVSGTPCTTLSNYNFDPNGFLNSVTRTDSSGTIKTEFTPDAYGNPKNEKVSATGSEFSAATFTTDRTFDTTTLSGLLLTRSEENLSPPWKSFDVTRDPAAGLITTSRDPNGLTTSYSWDALRRLTRVAPTGEMATTYCYQLVSAGSTYNYVLVKKDGTSACDTTSSPGWGSGLLEAYQYDGFGRIIREIRRQGGQTGLILSSSLALRQTRYNEAGLPSLVSEWTTCSNSSNVTSCFSTDVLGAMGAKYTQYGNYDFLDRARLITAADGTQTTKSFDDTLSTPPVLNSDFTEFTQSSNVGGNTVVSLSRNDVLGRVVKVSDPAIGTIAGVTSANLGPLMSYDYNVFDKLTDAKVNNTQTRTFTYDALGLLRSETHPETGTTNYNTFDARGKPLTWVPANAKTYAATYDPAGRQTLLAVNGTAYQQSVFDSGTPGTYYLGRLAQRTGFNAGTSPAYTITENFVYSDPTGRLSQKTTNVNSSPSLSVTEKWLYNPLGLVQNYFHPRAAGAAPFVVSTGYLSGHPVLVTANGVPVVTSAAYQPYGALSSYSTGDGTSHDVTTTITADPNLMPRPRQISTSGATTNFSTGSFSYDSAGNVLAMGSDSFGYDPVSRLTSANLYGVSSQTYGYDVYGNLLTRTGPNPLSLTVNTSTNRVAGYSYDSLGNLTTPPGEAISYDPLSQATMNNVAGDTWRYYYTGAGERVLRNSALTGNTFTLRDPDNRVTTEYAGSTAISRDNVFLGSLLVGSYANIAVSGNGTTPWIYYSSDHLGTPRLLTDNMGATVETRRSWPFGEDIGTPSTSERLRFATMERDAEGQRYHDHARSHSFGLARFMSPDRLGGKIEDSQSWNRYAYARNNPLKYVDPDGNASEVPWYQRVYNTVSGFVQAHFGSDSLSVTRANDERMQALREAGVSSSESSSLVDRGARINDSFAQVGGALAGGAAAGVVIAGEQAAIGEAFRAFESFGAFKRAFGPAGTGLEYHHLVEQSQAERFGAAAIQNTGNIVPMARDLHYKISGFYSSKQAFTGGVTVREWLSTKSYEEQRKFALAVFEQVNR